MRFPRRSLATVSHSFRRCPALPMTQALLRRDQNVRLLGRVASVDDFDAGEKDVHRLLGTNRRGAVEASSSRSAPIGLVGAVGEFRTETSEG